MPTRAFEPLILASGSPRRRDLLNDAGVHFEAIPAELVELERPGEPPAKLATRLAAEKALEVARRVGNRPRRWVLGADTVVVLGEDVLGKPGDPERALAMLERLTGRSHQVWTGIALVDSQELRAQTRAVMSEVYMRAASPEELRRYAHSGEPLDKAGAYALQGEGRRFVTRVDGSETNVIGLPMAETLALLRGAGADGLPA